jgi:uncharacterized Zn finger protein
MHPQPDPLWPEPVMADLAPCPRCGDTRAAADLVRRGEERVWVILCPACGTHLPDEPDARGFEDAVAFWNHGGR